MMLPDRGFSHNRTGLGYFACCHFKDLCRVIKIKIE